MEVQGLCNVLWLDVLAIGQISDGPGDLDNLEDATARQRLALRFATQESAGCGG